MGGVRSYVFAEMCICVAGTCDSDRMECGKMIKINSIYIYTQIKIYSFTLVKR